MLSTALLRRVVLREALLAGFVFEPDRPRDFDAAFDAALDFDIASALDLAAALVPVLAHTFFFFASTPVLASVVSPAGDFDSLTNLPLDELEAGSEIEDVVFVLLSPEGPADEGAVADGGATAEPGARALERFFRVFTGGGSMYPRSASTWRR